jgi:hypothetical protein
MGKKKNLTDIVKVLGMGSYEVRGKGVMPRGWAGLGSLGAYWEEAAGWQGW